MDLRQIILDSPDQLTRSLEVNESVKAEGNLPAGRQGFDSIVLAGMGGSGHPGDLLNALAVTTRPLYVHRNYDLPLAYLGQLGFSHTLAIASSYSGNTEEVISAYHSAREHKIPLLVSSAGGTLKELAEADNVPFCLIDYPDMQPRHTLFAAFAGIYIALQNSGLAQDITADIKRVAGILKEKTAALEKPAQALAATIKDKVPVFTASDTLGFAAKNFKIQTNENAKYPAFWNTFPELNHNELLGFSKLKESGNPNQFFVLMLRDPADHPRNQARLDVTRDLYREWGIAVEEFTAEGETLLEKICFTVIFGLWTTYHLALACGVDPVPVDGVEDFKKKLAEIVGEI